jgi:hypothetical protein
MTHLNRLGDANFRSRESSRCRDSCHIRTCRANAIFSDEAWQHYLHKRKVGALLPWAKSSDADVRREEFEETTFELPQSNGLNARHARRPAVASSVNE